MLVGYTVKLLMVIVLYIYMYSVNKARDRAAAVDEHEGLTTDKEREAIENGMHDMTEIDNKGFRYIL